jgi:hypothetical protein
VRRLAALALILATPLLAAATPDRTGDVTTCGAAGSVRDPVADVVSVDALADELGTAAVWRITFATRVPVPDTRGAPLRIDVLVRDPQLPARSLGDEQGMNRIVRWDATGADRPVDIVWLGGRGHTPFNPPEISDRTVEIRVPGRILLGEAPNGTESVRRARWSILVRDGDACDRVGDVPVFRLREPAQPTSPGIGMVFGQPTDGPQASNSIPYELLAAVFLVVVVVMVTAKWRRMG